MMPLGLRARLLLSSEAGQGVDRGRKSCVPIGPARGNVLLQRRAERAPMNVEHARADIADHALGRRDALVLQERED